MLVCRAWRDLIQSDPYCWTRISICSWKNAIACQHNLRDGLKRSASLPLHIVAHIGNADRGMSTVLVPHVGRIKTLRLSAIGDMEVGGTVASMMREMGTLILEELVIRTIEEDFSASSQALASLLEHIIAAAPNLRVLQFSPYSARMPMVKSGIPSLSSLTIALAGSQESIPPTGLLTFISQCPNLKSLIFSGYRMEQYQFPFEDESQASFREFDVDITLPLQFLQLTSLTVSCPTTGVSILRSINAPNLQSLILDGRDTQSLQEWDDWTSEQLHIALINLANRSPNLTNLEVIELPVSYDTWIWLFHGGHTGYYDGNESSAAPFQRLQSLTVDELSHISRISDYLGYEMEMEKVIKGMGDSIADANLSSLQRLHLRSVITISVDALVKFLRNRHELPQDRKTVPLELVIENCEELIVEHFEALRSLSGISFVFYESRRDGLYPRSWVRISHNSRS